MGCSPQTRAHNHNTRLRPEGDELLVGSGKASRRRWQRGGALPELNPYLEHHFLVVQPPLPPLTGMPCVNHVTALTGLDWEGFSLVSCQLLSPPPTALKPRSGPTSSRKMCQEGFLDTPLLSSVSHTYFSCYIELCNLSSHPPALPISQFFRFRGYFVVFAFLVPGWGRAGM